VYSVAVYTERRESLPALALTLIATTAAVTIVLASTPALPPAIYPVGLLLVWVVVSGVWLLGDLVRSRSAAVEELRQRNAELVVEREENARLAVADERARIARELHDAVAHSLSVMVVQAGAARRALETAEPGGEVAAGRARGALATIEATGRDTLGEMRRVVGALRPTGLANARSKVGATTPAQLVWILAPRLPEPDGSAPDDWKRVRVTLRARLPAPEAVAVPLQR
jgi:signal transduction histidine kinase